MPWGAPSRALIWSRRRKPGQDLTLTIDRRIQFLAHPRAPDTLLRTPAPAAVRGGDRRCHRRSAGDGEPADLQPERGRLSVTPYTHRNRAVTDVIEPGSTMKPLTVAAALEAGVITPHSMFNTNPGWMPNGRFRTTDHRNYGVLDTTGVITKSSNVGAAQIVRKAAQPGLLRLPAPLRLWPAARTAASRASRPACCCRAGALERHHQADHVLRLRPVVPRRCRSRRPTPRSATAAS